MQVSPLHTGITEQQLCYKAFLQHYLFSVQFILSFPIVI